MCCTYYYNYGWEKCFKYVFWISTYLESSLKTWELVQKKSDDDNIVVEIRVHIHIIVLYS